MLMKNPDYRSPNLKAMVDQDLNSMPDSYSPREAMFGQVVLALLFVIAILLRAFAGT